MELIQVIYNILLIFGGLLLIVMVVSYLASKSKIKALEMSHIAEVRETPKKLILETGVKSEQSGFSYQPVHKIHVEQANFRNTQAGPQIFPISSGQAREVKVVRQASSREDNTIKAVEERKTNNRRYTVVNKENKKVNSKVINFYL